VPRSGGTVLLVAARQPDLTDLLRAAGFAVEVRTRPLSAAELEKVEADLVIIFRGRLIGRGQAAALARRGTAVIEVLTVEPPGSSRAGWLRISNRISKTDLVQVAEATADWSAARASALAAAS
jgi:hypothetical protein